MDYLADYHVLNVGDYFVVLIRQNIINRISSIDHLTSQEYGLCVLGESITEGQWGLPPTKLIPELKQPVLDFLAHSGDHRDYRVKYYTLNFLKLNLGQTEGDFAFYTRLMIQSYIDIVNTIGKQQIINEN